ncbi:solute carrier family 25 member 46 [Trematomus bernacchii]|uniref:solute carrier family 25 member 46 n=1 Tax=Trematomus bernacchii TaxID=40690 RepID=UPI00146A40F1|nr:solute carrier family 25 member 46 [Trematomus bernacchii]
MDRSGFSRRPDSFDGLGYRGEGLGYRGDPLLGPRVTEPPDIPGAGTCTWPGEEPSERERTGRERRGPGREPAWRLRSPARCLQSSSVDSQVWNRTRQPVHRERARSPLHRLQEAVPGELPRPLLPPEPVQPVAVMYSITKAQGLKALWKGLGSTFIVHGITLGAEGVISELTPLPRELPHRWSLKQLAGHLLLKGLTAMVALPFYCASLIETVQSEIVRDEASSGLLDCLREGVTRLFGVGAPHSLRLLPLRWLLLPAALHGVLRYVITSCVQRGVLWLQQRGGRQRGGGHRDAPDLLDSYFPELLAGCAGALVADVLLFPLETALHRLSLQGTRTIIDSTDGSGGNGPLVLPVNTQYDGVSDCLLAVRRREGPAGFYRGVGALAAQYALQGALLGGARALLRVLLPEGGRGGA